MIEATVYFENGADPGALTEALKALPDLIRPVYFAEDEGKIVMANGLGDEARFRTFVKRNALGFFLYAENKTCIDISTPTVGYAKVTMDLPEQLSGELALTLFRCLADHKPVFGYACEYDEYKHRNRHYITLGKNRIEDWIGRKLEKYISGVYWYTLLSERLLERHGVKLADLVGEAEVCETLGDGSLHLVKFFESPEDWNANASRLDDLCERIEGVFSMRVVEAALAGVTNFHEYDEVIANWR
jgi:hypothetical protein